MVFTFAMSFAVTSSITWCVLRPLTAANMLRIIGASRPFDVRPPRRGPAGDSVPPSSDDGAVDVREHVLAHVLGVHRRDDGAVLDGHDERRAVQEDHGLARALAGGARNGVVEA